MTPDESQRLKHIETMVEDHGARIRLLETSAQAEHAATAKLDTRLDRIEKSIRYNLLTTITAVAGIMASVLVKGCS